MSGDEGMSSPHHRPLQPESRDRRLAAAASPWHAYIRPKGVARSPEIDLEESSSGRSTWPTQTTCPDSTTITRRSDEGKSPFLLRRFLPT